MTGATWAPSFTGGSLPPPSPGTFLAFIPLTNPMFREPRTRRDLVLEQFEASGRLPRTEAVESVGQLMARAGAGDYLAILAYLPDTPEVTAALKELRRRLTEKYGIPTTAGFGPRYLHSTGQLHKGGPDSGIFLQLTADHSGEIPIPGRPYDFGILADAQSTGDLQALQALGRRTARIELGTEPAAGIEKLTAGL